VSDIFISYASADRERAKAIADVLVAEGWSVWWDRVIPPGKQFDEVIEEALDGARCVVVLWSSASVASSWVKTEAAEAMRRKILIPALIEDVRIPLEFRRLQAADLSHWEGDRADPAWRQFVESVDREVKRPHVPDPEPIPVGPGPRPKPRPIDPAPPRRNKRTALIAGLVAGVLALSGFLFYVEQEKDRELARELLRERAASDEAQRKRELEAREEQDRLERARARNLPASQSRAEPTNRAARERTLRAVRPMRYRNRER
jgi:hypothetical protein